MIKNAKIEEENPLETKQTGVSTQPRPIWDDKFKCGAPGFQILANPFITKYAFIFI
jgi:hypothetical protein